MVGERRVGGGDGGRVCGGDDGRVCGDGWEREMGRGWVRERSCSYSVLFLKLTAVLVFMTLSAICLCSPQAALL